MTMKPETREALHGAIGAARSDDPRQHADLLRRLQDGAFLGDLDSEAEYQLASKFRLRVAQVLDALASNTAPSAQHTFIALTSDEVFLAHDERIIVLIRVSANVRPAPPQLVAFWDRYSQPEDGFAPTTITALVANGTSPAMALLERKLVDAAHEDEEKISWMRTDILSHRNDVVLLHMADRLLIDGLPESLRPFLIEALFDYRPDEWFKPAKSYSAPPIESASNESLDVLRRIGTRALTSAQLTDAQRFAVEGRLARIESVRAARQ